jgi:hypothetical protein
MPMQQETPLPIQAFPTGNAVSAKLTAAKYKIDTAVNAVKIVHGRVQRTNQPAGSQQLAFRLLA